MNPNLALSGLSKSVVFVISLEVLINLDIGQTYTAASTELFGYRSSLKNRIQRSIQHPDKLGA